MADINQVTLVGRLGQNPELKTLPSGESVVQISMATGKKWKDKEGNQRDETQWHNVSFFGRPAEVIAQYVSKGDMLGVTGEITYRKVEKNDGTTAYYTTIRGKDFMLIGGRNTDASEPQQRGSTQRQATPAPATQRGYGPARGSRQAPPPADDFDDDIPF